MQRQRSIVYLMCTFVFAFQHFFNARNFLVAKLLEGCHMLARDWMIPHKRIHGWGEQQRAHRVPRSHYAGLQSESDNITYVVWHGNKSVLKGYHMSSTIYLCMHEQIHILAELERLGCICSCIHNHAIKSLNKYDNIIIIYLLLHF